MLQTLKFEQVRKKVEFMIARKTSKLPTQNWVFSALKPNDENDHELVLSQLLKAHNYYNKLIEIEQNRRQEYRSLMDKQGEVKEKKEKIENLKKEKKSMHEQIRNNNSKNRKRENYPEYKKRIKEINEKIKTLNEEKKNIEKYRKDEITKTEIDKINKKAKENIRNIRKYGPSNEESPPYPGTYLLVEDSAESATKKKGAPPKFKSLPEKDPKCVEGRIGVQIQNNFTFKEILEGKSNYVKIQNPTQRYSKKFGHYTNKEYSNASIRVGSKDKKGNASKNGRTPIWVTFPVKFHRLPPESAYVKWVWFQRKKIADQFIYELCLSLESENFFPKKNNKKNDNKNIVGVDIGWRQLSNGDIRIAYCSDDQELTLTKDEVRKLLHPDELQSIRDNNFNEAIKCLIDQFGEKKLKEEGAENIQQWKSPRRLIKFAKKWKNAPSWLTNKKELRKVKGKQRWIRTDYFTKENHLYQWQTFEKNKAISYIEEKYRKFACNLAEQYDKITIENFDMARLKQKSRPEDNKQLGNKARHMGYITAPAKFWKALYLVSPKRGCEIIEIPSYHTSKDCNQCGFTQQNLNSKLKYNCESCGAEWDRDKNAALNIKNKCL